MSSDVDIEGADEARELRGLLLFVGEFAHTMDGKMRMTIPSVWRAQVGSPGMLYVLPDFHRPCLNIYPAEAMRKKLERLQEQASMGNEGAMCFCTELGAASDLVSWDNNGRIRICDKLLHFAGLTDRVILVGALDKIQLWNPNVRGMGGSVDQAGLREWSKHIVF